MRSPVQQPRRSILKAIPAFQLDANHTIAIPPSETSARLAAWSEAHAHTTDLSSLTASASAPSQLASQAQAQPPQPPNNKGRRSSLKPPPALATASVQQAAPHEGDSDDEDEDVDDPNGSLDMDMTRFETTAAYDAEGRRKSVSHSRRVSFAPNAHIR